MLEPCDGKLSRTVLRGEGSREAPDLPGGTRIQRHIKMKKLIEILRHALEAPLEDGWLFLPKAKNWGSDTQGMIIDIDLLSDEDLDVEGLPAIAAQNGLIISLDNSTIEDIVSVAKQIDDPPSDELLVEAFLYYFEHDAFLPERGYVPLPVN